ncbi:MAG: ABC transporter ATP-binding protein [bacterium]|nr:ABC transporter ATP-binding protein [bacterium]
MALITCKDLSLGYEGKAIVSNLNFSVQKGDYLCIVGENGSGKSTLMKTMLHLLQPLGGRIELGEGLRQREIGYLPQQTVVQRDFPASVQEIVLSGCQGRFGFHPFYTKADKALAMEMLEKTGMQEYAKHCYRELSGGQQQRVLLARALCATQKVLLLDEPVSGLDPKAMANMYQTIAELNQKEGITILMISHDMEGALPYATHVLHIGRSLFFGSKQEYQKSEIGRMFAGAMGGEKEGMKA